MNIGQICTREVVMTDRASTLQQAATLMREQTEIAAVSHDMSALSAAVRTGIDRETAERGKLEPAPPPPRAVHIPAWSFT